MAAFISKLCFSAQQWSDEFYHGQGININYVTCRVWALGYIKVTKKTGSIRKKGSNQRNATW